MCTRSHDHKQKSIDYKKGEAGQTTRRSTYETDHLPLMNLLELLGLLDLVGVAHTALLAHPLGRHRHSARYRLGSGSDTGAVTGQVHV